MSNRIFVVTHQEPSFNLPAGYSYIGVGEKNYYTEYRDDEGMNIADKNPYYCELTALYWIWKNYKCADDDIVGLAHYRRALTDKNLLSFFLKRVLSLNNIKKTLDFKDVILSIPGKLNDGIYAQYENAHNISDLEFCFQELIDKHQIRTDCLNSFKNEKFASFYNMIICRKSTLDRYCEWVFPILFAVESRLDLTSRSSYQKRAMGFLAERLLNLWLFSNSDISTSHFPILRLDKSGLSNLNRLRKKAF